MGAELVAFDRRDLPIYAAPTSDLWAAAGHDPAPYGASLDRVYGDTGDVFIASMPLVEEPREIAALSDDRLVVLPGLGEGLILPACEHVPGLDLAAHDPPVHDATTSYEFTDPSHILLPAHDGWSWDLARPEWFYDHHV
jgi:hypothetical protein